MNNMDHLKKELDDLNYKIRDLENRIPPHSPQPSIYMELDELEAKRNKLAELIKITVADK